MGTIIRAKSIRVYNLLYAPILSYNMMKKTRFRQTRSHDTKYFKKRHNVAQITAQIWKKNTQ